MEDWMPVKPRHKHHLNLLASHLGSGKVRMSPLQTGPLCIPCDGVVTVIQEPNMNLCTSLLGPDTPTLLAISSSWNLNPGLIKLLNITPVKNNFIVCALHLRI